MYILPKPRGINLKQGFFSINPQTEIILDNKCNFNDFESALQLKEEIEKIIGFQLSINRGDIKKSSNYIYLKKQAANAKIEYTSANGDVKKIERESYRLLIEQEGITLYSSFEEGIFYGVQTLRQLFRINGITLDCLEIIDWPDFSDRGFYHDVTRGKVPTLETLKELVDRAAFYKLNQLQLYVEHTFAFKNHSELWGDSDPLTSEEILVLDRYCKKNHVELVPSLATFGHLYHALSSKSFNHICELEGSCGKSFSWIERMGHHTLDASNEESIEFVRDMLGQFIPLFSSDKFNICCDETFDLGMGRSKELAEKIGKGRLYVDFLNKIINIVKEHNKIPMFWGDIIVKHSEFMNDIPKDVICLNWNYSPNADDINTKLISKYGIKQYVCPGVSGWDRLMNDIEGSFNNINRMIKYGKEYNASGVLNTDWGDYGHINLFANSMSGMIYGAALSWNVNESEEEFSSMYKRISRIEFEDKTETIVGLLERLSKSQAVSFMEIVWWKEDKFKESDLLLRKPEYKQKYLLNLSEEEFHIKYKKAIEIEREILKYLSQAPQHKKVDFMEFYISSKGIALINSLYLIIKKYEFSEEVEKLIHTPRQLAVEIEYWLSNYCKIWRIRNKESELFRIKDTFMKICSCLREYSR